MARKRRSYDDKFRASAVIMLEAQGYPETKGALQAVSNHIGVSISTLHGWFKAKVSPAISELRNETAIDFKQALKNELTAIVGLLPDKRGEATYKELVTSLGILLDKLRLLEDKPTEISEQRHSGNIKLTTEERDSRLAELLESARTRRDGLPANNADNPNVH
jgi:transposase-like protein